MKPDSGAQGRKKNRSALECFAAQTILFPQELSGGLVGKEPTVEEILAAFLGEREAPFEGLRSFV